MTARLLFGQGMEQERDLIRELVAEWVARGPQRGGPKRGDPKHGTHHAGPSPRGWSRRVLCTHPR